jgi:hypothetical protein
MRKCRLLYLCTVSGNFEIQQASPVGQDQRVLEMFTGEKFTYRLQRYRCLSLIHLNPRRFAMIMLSSLTEHLVLIATLTLMLGLARVAYGGQAD